MRKKCFKCRRTKLIDDFYKHPKMADGHLGKCKACTKKDVSDRYASPWGREKCLNYEKKRWKLPARRAKAMEYQRRRREKFPGKERARTAVANAIRDGRLVRLPCEICGGNAQAHHDDYRRPLVVRWMCFKHHREHAHGQKVGL